jgi:hypothetical protein
MMKKFNYYKKDSFFCKSVIYSSNDNTNTTTTTNSNTKNTNEHNTLSSLPTSSSDTHFYQYKYHIVKPSYLTNILFLIDCYSIDKEYSNHLVYYYYYYYKVVFNKIIFYNLENRLTDRLFTSHNDTDIFHTIIITNIHIDKLNKQEKYSTYIMNFIINNTTSTDTTSIDITNNTSTTTTTTTINTNNYIVEFDRVIYIKQFSHIPLVIIDYDYYKTYCFSYSNNLLKDFMISIQLSILSSTNIYINKNNHIYFSIINSNTITNSNDDHHENNSLINNTMLTLLYKLHIDTFYSITLYIYNNNNNK